MSYVDLCETWWKRWLEGKCAPSSWVRDAFVLDAAPEPYLVFGEDVDPLCVLTTNPGGAMPHQLRENIESGDSFLSKTMSYAEAARSLASFYVRTLTGTASRRIAAQTEIAAASGFSGVLQVECIPWHSSNLPEKTKILQSIEEDEDLRVYTRRLRAFIARRATIALAAVSPRFDFTTRPRRLSPWVSWLFEILGVDPDRADSIPLTAKGDRVTSAALVPNATGTPKAIVLMMGGNHFPSRENREPLVQALARWRDSSGGDSPP